MNLEIFDLFGETIFCSICLNDIDEGVRVTEIKSCKHAFHQTCIDPWLLKETSCPNCRGSVVIKDGVQITSAVSLQRAFLSWIFIDWVLARYPTSESFRSRSDEIRNYVQRFQYEGNRLYPLDASSKTSFLREKMNMNKKIQLFLQRQDVNAKVYRNVNLYDNVPRLKEQIYPLFTRAL